MSFDIFLSCYKNRKSATANQAAVEQVLARTQYEGADGYYLIKLADGAVVEFSAKELRVSPASVDPNELHKLPFGGRLVPRGPAFASCAFFVRGFTPQLADFIFEVARAGGFSIEAAGGDVLPTILVSESQRADVPHDEERGAVVVDSGEDLMRLLTTSYEKWQAYRDQVMSGTPTNEKPVTRRAKTSKKSPAKERAKRKVIAKPKSKAAKSPAKKRIAKKPAAKKRKPASKRKNKR